LHFLFAWRYFKAKKSTNAINIIAWISITAIVFGTAVLVLVLSVFNGFEGLVKSLYSSFYTDLKVSPVSGKTITVTPEQLQKMKGIDGIRNFSLVVEEKALLQTKTRFFGKEDEPRENQMLIYLKGVDENYRYVTGVADHILKGDFDLGNAETPKLILGAGIESSLNINAGNHLDPLIIYMPRKGETELLDPLRSFSTDTITVAAAFIIQQDFDNKYGITNIGFVKQALKLSEDEYGGIEITLKDPAKANEIKKELNQLFGTGYLVQNKYEQNRSLYSVMNLERWVIYGILSLILVVAAFNMIGALTMLVLEKQKDISVLHALGGDRNFIQKIFLSEGLLLAMIGGGAGMLLALLIAWAQINFHLIPLQGGSFLIDYFPVKLKLTDFLLVGVTVLVIALIASWIPARKAAMQDFSLRSE
jgi:lipoprotein-releasing system permease protein